MKKITMIIALLLVMQLAKAQDSCAAAVPITTAGLYVVGPINGAEPGVMCAPNGSGTNTGDPAAGEWYAYTPTANHTVTITTDISQNTPRVDTRFHVYTGACDVLACLAGDDDSGSNFSSVATFDVQANMTYIIAFDNKWSSDGFTFQLIENAVVVPPVTPINYTTQTISTINSTYNICSVDMNGDHLDDIVGVSGNNLRIHYQGAGGTFTVADYAIAGTSKMPGWSMAAGDYNRDGYNDLVLGSGSGLSVWSSNAGGTAYSNFSPTDYIFCQRTNFADLNKDGNLDVFSCHDIDANVYYLNDGAGNLTYYQSNTTPGAMNLSSVANKGGNYSTLFTDFDNDGDTDVFISKCSGPPCQLFRYDGGNVYTNVSATAGIDVTPVQTWSSAIADFDNDGDMDIIITASAGTHKFFRNNFDTSNTLAFTNITSGSGWDTNSSTNIDNVAYDFDNDGLVDVLGGGSKIMFNQGNNTFAPIVYSGMSIGAVADLNNDGFLDIQNNNVVRYAVPNGNHWLTVALTGIQSNSNGIGARIEIYGSWGKQIRDIRSGEGFKYMGSLNAHFGLGQATTIDEVVIKWPSGVVDTLHNVSPNQMLAVIEGSTLGTNSYNTTAFTIYPNPVKNTINLTMNSSAELLTAEIFDLNGRRVSESKIVNNTVAVDHLATGSYILVLRDASNKGYSQKFIKE
ncbi:FG-GAP-like repeat-containing protein [Flavobacterium sp. XGLA_31]|uniref:FG-GAP-like repeat-containing protein n=1 Tax=Flavobacterium sp. XGLA_31 TaxID=3447666 RepID=UPI003F32ADA1